MSREAGREAVMPALVDSHYVYVYVLLVVKGRIKGPMQMKTTVVVHEGDNQKCRQKIDRQLLHFGESSFRLAPRHWIEGIRYYYSPGDVE